MTATPVMENGSGAAMPPLSYSAHGKPVKGFRREAARTEEWALRPARSKAELTDVRLWQAMIRLRRASVIATLSLLSWATTASAECAWILWSYSFDTGSHMQNYDLDSAQATRQECGEAIEAVATGLKKRGYNNIAGGFRGSYEVLGTLGTRNVRYFCLPDTVDPRGAKEK